MHRSALLSLFAVILLALIAALLPGVGRPVGGASNPRAQGGSARPSAFETVLPIEVAALASGAEAIERQELQAPLDVPSAPAGPRCVVLGRFVDEAGAPLPGVEVILGGYRAWADGADGVDVVPRPGRPNRIDFVLMTDLDGRFRFDVPVPTVERQFLEAKPSPFVDSFMRYFGDVTLGNHPALAEGQRDLGNLRLARAGVIRGRVVDEFGRPIEDVGLGTDENRRANDSRGGVSDADGRFEIAHARIGTYRVWAWKTGWINNFRDAVTVEVEQVTADVVLVLMPAKTIEGRVVDTLGQPVGNVKFWGWPSSSGSGAGGRSGDDGRFVISLPQDEPYSLEAKCDGYSTWGKGHGVFYEPGTRDLKIVMETIAPTQFRAMDDVTGEPLMSFGLDILEENGSKSLRSMFSKRRRPRIESPADGVLARTARPGIDLFVAAADGYLLAEGDVEHRPNGEPEQTIRLRRAAVVMGRALRDGQPVVNSVVQLAVVSIQFVESQARSPSYQQNFGEQEEVILWSGVEGSDSVTAYTDAHGRFALSPINSGTLRLTVDVGRGASLVCGPLAVETGATLELGDLEAVCSGTIEGTVSTPAWVAPLGLIIAFDDQLDEIEATVNDRGRFRFDDVAPGVHSLKLQGRRGELSAPPSLVVQVAAGETTRVTFAAEEYGECRVRVHVTGSAAEVLERSSVWPQWVEPGLWPSFFESLGRLDETARVAGSLLAQGKVTFRLHTPGGTSLHFATPVVDLESAGEHDVELVLPLGAVSLTLPFGLPVPEDTYISIDATAPGETEPAWSHGSRLPSGSVLDIPQCLAGRWTLAVKLTSKSTPSPEVQPPDGGQSETRPALYEAQLEVQVPEGGRANVTLP